MRLAVDEEPHRGVVGPLGVDDVCFPFGRFRLPDIGERERIARVRRGEHPEREAHEILLERIDSGLASGLLLGRVRGWCAGASRRSRRWRRHGKLNQILAVEACRGGAGLLGRNLIFPDVLVRELDRDLKLDRDEVVAADLARAARGHEVFHRGNLLFASERLTRRGEDCGWIFGRRLRRGEQRCSQSRDQSKRGSNTHQSTP
jgi:hypothetical protein